MQRRLGAADVDQVVADYLAGYSLQQIAVARGVHRRTIAVHLENRGVPRRPSARKLTERDVAKATHRYLSGDALATVAAAFQVDASTVRRELHRAGVAIRPRRGEC